MLAMHWWLSRHLGALMRQPKCGTAVASWRPHPAACAQCLQAAARFHTASSCLSTHNSIALPDRARGRAGPGAHPGPASRQSAPRGFRGPSSPSRSWPAARHRPCRRRGCAPAMPAQPRALLRKAGTRTRAGNQDARLDAQDGGVPPMRKKSPEARRVMGGCTEAAWSVWMAPMLIAATASCWNDSVSRPMPCMRAHTMAASASTPTLPCVCTPVHTCKHQGSAVTVRVTSESQCITVSVAAALHACAQQPRVQPLLLLLAHPGWSKLAGRHSRAAAHLEYQWYPVFALFLGHLTAAPPW